MRTNGFFSQLSLWRLASPSRAVRISLESRLQSEKPSLSALLRLLMITLAAGGGLAGAAHASDCAFTAAPAARLQSMTAVSDYQPVLKACVAPDARKAVAIREMTVAGQKVDLLADPEALTTRLERAACWTCREESE